MDEMRDAMARHLAVSGYAETTQRAYLDVVKRLAAHYGIQPDLLTDDQVADYFILLAQQRRISQGLYKVVHAAITLFYRKICRREIEGMSDWRAPRRTTIPEVMSIDEVRRTLAVVRDDNAYACLVTTYGCGLRSGEASRLEVSDIDAPRQVIHIRRGKGGKDRLVPLTPALLHVLREHWRTHRNPRFLFPGGDGTRPVATERLLCIFKCAALEAGVRRPVTLHTLRHSYASHLYDAGHDLRVIQHLLGHANIQTTTIYVHVSQRTLEAPMCTANALIEQIVSCKRG